MKDEAFVTSVMSKMSFQIDFPGSCIFGLGTAFGGLFVFTRPNSNENCINPKGVFTLVL